MDCKDVHTMVTTTDCKNQITNAKWMNLYPLKSPVQISHGLQEIQLVSRSLLISMVLWFVWCLWFCFCFSLFCCCRPPCSFTQCLAAWKLMIRRWDYGLLSIVNWGKSIWFVFICIDWNKQFEMSHTHKNTHAHAHGREHARTRAHTIASSNIIVDENFFAEFSVRWLELCACQSFLFDGFRLSKNEKTTDSFWKSNCTAPKEQQMTKK